MRKAALMLLATLLLVGFVWANAETGIADLTGDWTMNYFGIPMYYFFYEDGTFEGMPAMDIPVAEDGSNSFTGTWEFDGTTLDMHGDDGDAQFTWDGEKLTGIMFDATVVMQRAVETENQEN